MAHICRRLSWRSLRYFSTSPKKCKEPKRDWTWSEIKRINQYRGETELLFGPSKPKSKSNIKKSAAERDDLLYDDLEFSAEDVSLKQSKQKTIERSPEISNKDSESRSVINGETESSSLKASTNSTPLESAPVYDEDFIDYADDPVEAEIAPSPVNVKKTFVKTKKQTASNYIESSFPRKFPIIKSPIDHILTYPLLPDDQTAPEISEEAFKLKNGKFPGVTRILGETMSPESKAALEMWEKKMIEELGEEGFKQLKADTFRNGHQLHSCIEMRLQGVDEGDLEITEPIQGHWKSVSPVFGDVGEVLFTEGRVNHPVLRYSGIFDCVGYYKGTLCVMDWKTSKKPKKRIQHTYDNPLQLAAYVGALNHDNEYPQNIHEAVLVIAYENGSPANVFKLSHNQLTFYWKKWVSRLHQYWTMANER